MTTLREAAQQALEALEWASDLNQVAAEYKPMHEAIASLRAALAEPVQEPVAWTGYDLDAMVEAFDRVIEAHFSKAHPFHDPTNMDAKMALRILRGLIPAMKAYTSQPQRTAEPERKPLTKVDLRALYDRHAAYQEEGPEASGWWDFARAIERAHGIWGAE